MRPTKYHLVSEFVLTSQRQVVWEALVTIREWRSRFGPPSDGCWVLPDAGGAL